MRASGVDRGRETVLSAREIADSSLAQDRITKAAIYAGTGIPDYWLVNLREGCVEMFRAPERDMRRYTSATIGRRGEHIRLLTFPDVSVAVDDVLAPD